MNLLHQASRTLDNTEILVLPTTRYDLVGRPGANRIVVVDRGVWDKDFTGGAYTGGSDTSFLALYLVDENDNSAQSNFVEAASFRDASAVRTLGTACEDLGAGDLLGVLKEVGSPDPDTSIQITLSGFDADFDPGSGDAANTLTVGFTFLVWDTVEKAFLTTTESGWDETTRTFV